MAIQTTPAPESTPESAEPVEIDLLRGGASVQDLLDCASQMFPGISLSDLMIVLSSNDLGITMRPRRCLIHDFGDSFYG